MNRDVGPCPDCRVGFYLCPEAARLWWVRGRAYHTGVATGDYTEYDAAGVAYRVHVCGSAAGRPAVDGAT